MSCLDKEVQKGLSDRLYDKRKVAALELEQSIRECLANDDRDKIKSIIDQLCRDFAYAVHHPNARNGGLIGLAAAAIALGQNEVINYLEDIIHPVLACFGDQDARVRYYACESMYNIAKVAKGEILLYFNEIFDALCKLSTDSELSVKNGADLLDRLIKDIVAEKAATYVSIVHKNAPALATLEEEEDLTKPTIIHNLPQDETTFSLPKFIPLLMERIYAINPLARMFLVSWVTLLDSIPDLELISYLPTFLGGLISFLSDPSKEVKAATHAALDGFLNEIKRITHIKKTVAMNMEQRALKKKKSIEPNKPIVTRRESESTHKSAESIPLELQSTPRISEDNEKGRNAVIENNHHGQQQEHEQGQEEVEEGEEINNDDFYIPGQDVQINFDKIIEILISHLDSSDEQIHLTVLSWIVTLMEVSPYSLLPYTPRFLSVLLPTMAYDGNDLRDAAERVNKKLLQLIVAIPENFHENPENGDKLDYSATVNSLTLHFLNEKEQTRVAALDWLIMLHRKVPRRILAINDGTFPALLKTLSDPSDLVITKDLQLLAQISYNSDDEYFTVFMVNLLNLFSTDRRLLEVRGKMIVRQLCISLNPERIYRTLAEILEKDDDAEFASIMVQNLSNNLITAPELSDLRMRLRNLDTREGAIFFISLFKSWCHNSAATLALCLLAQAYEYAFQLIQILVEFEMTVDLLIQIDRLVQLLESPVFTHLRLQLLEPDKYPYLYKCLYGLLMLLPQSKAFTTLRNRLNSVSPIAYIQLPARSNVKTTTTTTTAAAAAGKYLQNRDDVRWSELLDKFRSVQRKHQENKRKAFSRTVSEVELSQTNNFDQTPDLATFRRLKDKATIQGISNNVTVGQNGRAGANKDVGGSTSGGGGGIRRFTSKGPFGLKRSTDDKRK